MSNSKLNKVEMDCLAEALDLLDRHKILPIALTTQTLEDEGFEGLFELLNITNSEEELRKAKGWIIYNHKVAPDIAAGGSTPVEDSIQKVSILRDSSNGKEEITIKVNEKDIYKHDFNYKGNSEYLNHIQVKLD